jgi:hypothetical protein
MSTLTNWYHNDCGGKIKVKNEEYEDVNIAGFSCYSIGLTFNWNSIY